MARRTYDRLANLERDGAATRQELDQAEAALRTAEAMVAEASASRDYFTLRAPFDGTVTSRYADPGDLAVPGRPVLVISGSQGVKIVADLPASLAGAVADGGSIAVVSPETGRAVAGHGAPGGPGDRPGQSAVPGRGDVRRVHQVFRPPVRSCGSRSRAAESRVPGCRPTPWFVADSCRECSS